MAVKITGGVLSSAILDISQCFSDQEGLILGEAALHVKNEIDDLQINNRVEYLQYDVKYFVACPNLRAFYNKKGRVLPDKLAELTKGYSSKRVIGWYKSRHNSTHRLSYTEKLVSRSFYQMSRRKSDMEEIPPLFALFTSQHNHNKASIQIDYTFNQQLERVAQPLPVAIQNLGKTMSQYKTENKSHGASSPYQLSLDKHKTVFYGEDNSPQSIGRINLLVKDVNEQLQKVCRQVITSETEIRELEKEVDQLRRRLCTEISSPTKPVRVYRSASTSSDKGSATPGPHSPRSPRSPSVKSHSPDLIDLNDVKTLKLTAEEAKAPITVSSPKLARNQSPTTERQRSNQTANHIGSDSDSTDPSSSPVY